MADGPDYLFNKPPFSGFRVAHNIPENEFAIKSDLVSNSR